MQMAMRYSIVHICNPLYYSANGTYNVYVWRCIWDPFYDSAHCIYVLKGAYCTHLIIVQMALGIQMCKWHSCMENMHMALIMSIFLQIALAFKGLQYFIMLNAYTI